MAFVYMACMCMLQMQKTHAEQQALFVLFDVKWNVWAVTCGVAKNETFHPTPNTCNLNFRVQGFATNHYKQGFAWDAVCGTRTQVLMFQAECFASGENIPQTEFPTKLALVRVSAAIQVQTFLLFWHQTSSFDVMFQGEILNRRKHTSNLSCCRFALSFYFRLFHRAQRQITDLFMKNKGPFATNEDFDKAPHVYDPLTIWNGLPWFALRVGASFLNQNPKSLETPKKPRAQARAHVVLFVPCNGELLMLHSFIPG